ncbi:MAG: hypothetical protein OXE94_13190 [Aestuariivita sp.]|nr:hypothetical protein [Aestuariivita sp.]MCY4204073.1 hypothetical protein [Aestuariivita sp.]MCY4286977.1 hypothetical protein [Aestuariivita sp.]MCY4347995.1 hypothetical protein [Aestuariivita sp.]
MKCIATTVRIQDYDGYVDRDVDKDKIAVVAATLVKSKWSGAAISIITERPFPA